MVLATGSPSCTGTTREAIADTAAHSLMGHFCPGTFAREGTWAVLIVFLLGLAGPDASAQTIWPRPYETNRIALEAVAPSLLTGQESGVSGGAFLSGTYLVTDRVEVAAELPVAHSIASDVSSSPTVGNPYVGIGLSGISTPVLLEIGARLPVASSAPPLRAAATADAGRTQAFRPNEVSVSGLMSGRMKIGGGSTLRLRAGGAYGSFAATDTTDQRTEQDWRAQYSLQYWHEGQPFVLGLGVSGEMRLSGSERFADKSRHYVVGSAILDHSVAQPGLLLGLALDGFSDAALLVGVTLAVPYGR